MSPVAVEPSSFTAYSAVRGLTRALCAPLAPDDFGVQPREEVSPPKWHLAHTTWYFETFVLAHADPGYRPCDPRWAALFNSYYQGVGVPFPRPRRGALSRPTLEQVWAYRAEVDRRMQALLEGGGVGEELAFRITLGLNHEQQHQELLLMDVKQILGSAPLRAAYRAQDPPVAPPELPLTFLEVPGGDVELGHAGAGFCFDNERPRHVQRLAPYRIANRPVTNADYLAFVEDGGYRRPELWLADGWATVQRQGWTSPDLWFHADGAWQEYTLHGAFPLQLQAPVTHVSFYEAQAYAAWAGARLPSEGEWEHAAAQAPLEGQLLQGPSDWLHPLPATPGPGLRAACGGVWEWTHSPYAPYPGFRPFQGALGEYNGKFMCNQFVLRGGCCATPADHLRWTYRNFYYPHDRWAFTGIRLAQDPD